MADENNATLKEIRENGARDLAEAELCFKTAIAGIDARAAFASYAFYRLATSRERPSNYARPMPAGIEHAAWLLYPEFEKGTGQDAGQIQAVIDAIETHASALAFAEIFPQKGGQHEDDHLEMHLRLHSGLVRGSGYPQQVARRIDQLLRPFEKEFASAFGIGPGRAFDVLKSLGVLIENKINRMRDRYGEGAKRCEVLRRKGRLDEPHENELKQLAVTLNEVLNEMEGAWVPSRNDLVPLVGELTDKEWNGLRTIVGFTPTVRSKLAALVEVQDHPLFFLDDTHAFYAHGVSCFDAIFTFFDQAARDDSSMRDRYGNHLAKWMEEEALRQMLRLFPESAIIKNACFPDPDKEKGETEADLVIVWGPFLVIIEAKGKRVAREALRGSGAKLRNALKSNIQDAFYQAHRVIQVLERDGGIQFKERTTGRTIEVKLDQLRRVMPISVTLQHLSGIPTQLAITRKLGLFKGNAYPWSVCIDDLDVISRFSESPDVFLHYIERRIAHQHLDINLTGDELDMFGQYLDNRLHPSVYEQNHEIASYDGPRMISFDGGEEKFEAFYTAEWYGRQPPQESVELKIASRLKEIFKELRRRTDDGARWIAFALLSLSTETLAKLNAAIRDLKQARGQDRQIVRATAQEGDVVVNVLVHNGLDSATFRENAIARTQIEHYRTKTSKAVTIGIDRSDPTKPFDFALWLEGEWEQDEVMDNIIAQERAEPRTVQILRKGKKIGRNDPCPCGSGRKLKHCCIGSLRFKRS